MSDEHCVTCCWTKTGAMTSEMADIDGYGVPPYKCTICKLKQEREHEHEETDSASVIAANQASQTEFLKHTVKGIIKVYNIHAVTVTLHAKVLF